jgi:hypothetical protein
MCLKGHRGTILLAMTPPLQYIDISLPHEAMTLGEYRKTRTKPPVRRARLRTLLAR